MKFKDKIKFKKKKVISCRDGVQEYYGEELGMTPSNKIFKVYRSPTTIRKLKDTMTNIPIINEHENPTGKVKSKIGGHIRDSEIIEAKGGNNETMALSHNVSLDKRILSIIDSGKIEVSLGYTAELVDHDVYDLEQVDITPHHLAIVSRGRCGDTCKFKDKRKSMEKFMKAWNALSKDEQEAFIAKFGGKNAEPKTEVTDSQEFKDAMTVALADAKADYEKKLGEVKVKLSDEAKKAIKDEALKEHKERKEIVDKAIKILGAGYDAKDKDTQTIMKDTLAKEFKDVKFEDGEIAGAFKALQSKKTQVTDYKQFGDNKPNKTWNNTYEVEV